MSRVKLSAHDEFMDLALTEARKGLGKTAPNPPVGAVLVKGGRVLAKGYHAKAGGAHAEKKVLRRPEQTRGGTLYVTLEPCCHYPKKTPPCVPAIIESKVKRVVVGCKDPNPKVAGKGIRALRRAGIEVVLGVRQQAAQELIRYFHHAIKTGRPYTLLKIASSLDGRVALANGTSQWITSEKSRRQVHILRAEMDAILVGVGTVQKDNPRLNARAGRGSAPMRVILDPHLKISPRAKVLNPKYGERRLVVTRSKELRTRKAKSLLSAGAELIESPWNKKNGFQLKPLLAQLNKLGVHSLMVEGGPATWTKFWQAGLWNELHLFLAPKILGGDGLSWMGSLGLKTLPNQGLGRPHAIQQLGEDLWLAYRKLR
jgi:diaminohydroxyphosphoribosylaminopyrimidine deaminase/5-amino-6-(5-phosphoribosylamino)uracil reductase